MDPWLEARVIIESGSDCWIWRLAKQHKTGYGRYDGRIRGGPGNAAVVSGAVWLAHRYVWSELYDRPLPENLGHTCPNRACVNPDHMIALTFAESQRRTHVVEVCVNGHAMTEGNTHVRKDGRGRQCMTCNRERQHRYGVRRKELLGTYSPRLTAEQKLQRNRRLRERLKTDPLYKARVRKRYLARYLLKSYGMDIEALGNRADWTCYLCCEALTAYEPLEIDHVVPVARGGSGHPDNLALVHRHCNRRKSDVHPLDLAWTPGSTLDRIASALSVCPASGDTTWHNSDNVHVPAM